MNVSSIVLFVAGVVLIYSGVKNVKPQDVVKNSLNGKSPNDAPRRGGGGSIPTPPPSPTPPVTGGGPGYAIVSV